MKLLLASLLLLSSAFGAPQRCPTPPTPRVTVDQVIRHLERQRADVVREREINRTAAAFMAQITGRADPFFAFWIDEETHAIQAIDDTISVIKFGHIEWRQ